MPQTYDRGFSSKKSKPPAVKKMAKVGRAAASSSAAAGAIGKAVASYKVTKRQAAKKTVARKRRAL